MLLLSAAIIRNRGLLLLGFLSLVVLSALVLFYLGTFAPIISAEKCGFLTKVHFGLMLRCQCTHGLVREWQIDGPDRAQAAIVRMGADNESWDVILDGHYFFSPTE